MKGRREHQRTLTDIAGGFLLVTLVILIVAIPSFEHFFFSNSQTSKIQISISAVDSEKQSLKLDLGSQNSTIELLAEAPAAAPVLQPITPPSDEKEQKISSSSGPILPLPSDASTAIRCNTSYYRTDVCEIAGETRIQGSSFSVSFSGGGSNRLWKIRPYPRKWEKHLMPEINEYTIKDTRTTAAKTATACSVNHSVPAVVFSTGGILGKNFFHDLSDVLIPLFLTVNRFKGEIKFFITQRNPIWFSKYEPVLKFLTNYEPIYGDNDDKIHCFPSSIVGLYSHSELSIFPKEYPSNGTSMEDFRRLLRKAYNLKREFPSKLQEGDKPRLVFLSRKQARSLLNERAVLALARKLGFKVLVAPPEAVRDMVGFARTVNSCHVLMGVHGAGLTNMVFLPTNATMVQVIPWGELKYACRYSYGDPALGMGMKYKEYEVGMEETSLKKKYPRDHPVFKDPLSIHRQGYNVAWDIFISHQNVSLDLRRFRPFLKETFDSLYQ